MSAAHDVYYAAFKYGLFRPFIKLLWRPVVQGAEHIPSTGGAVLASNHVGAADSLVIPGMIRRRLTYPAKAELFEGTDLRGRVVAWFLTVIGQVPMDRSGGRASADGLGPILDALKRGELVAIYPEGTRTPDGRLYKGRTGVARLALAARAPVVPVGVSGTQLKKGPLGIPLMHRPIIRFGRPLDFSSYASDDPDDHANGETLRWVTDEIMNAIMQLSGQVYVDTYATNVKYGALRGKDTSHLEIGRPGQGRTPPGRVTARS